MLHHNKLVTIFGGSGFIGRHVVEALAKQGYLIRIACRNPALATHLSPLCEAGRIQFIQTNIRYKESIAQAVAHSDYVINLVGILFEKGKQNFQTIHAIAPALIAEACNEAGARLTHISALGASETAQSKYARSKREGEVSILSIQKNAIIFRPSIVFGVEDNFFNKFAHMACYLPALPLLHEGKTRLQPIFVGDLAQAIVQSLPEEKDAGKIYEIGGPEILSFYACLTRMLEIIQRKRFLLPIPLPIAKILAHIFSILPYPPFTIDQLALLEQDNIVSQKAIEEDRTLAHFPIVPQPLSSILPSYLARYRKQGEFSKPPAV